MQVVICLIFSKTLKACRNVLIKDGRENNKGHSNENEYYPNPNLPIELLAKNNHAYDKSRKGFHSAEYRGKCRTNAFDGIHQRQIRYQRWEKGKANQVNPSDGCRYCVNPFTNHKGVDDKIDIATHQRVECQLDVVATAEYLYIVYKHNIQSVCKPRE